MYFIFILVCCLSLKTTRLEGRNNCILQMLQLICIVSRVQMCINIFNIKNYLKEINQNNDEKRLYQGLSQLSIMMMHRQFIMFHLYT